MNSAQCRRSQAGHERNDPTDDGAGAGALSRGAVATRRPASRLVRRRVRDLRPRQRRRHRRGAVPASRRACRRYRAHNEQAMAHAAIAYAKAHFRRRMMACTTSIGPGATNLVTAAALAHVNRLPVLLLPGDIFVSRAPDPVLQQVEDFHDGGVSANDCFKPVSRYFDRIVHPAQLLTALPRAIARADRRGAVRPGDARAAAGRAGDGLRLSRGVLRAARRARFARRAPDARRARARPPRCCATREAAADRRRRRRALRRAPPTRCARSPSAHGVPVAETQAGKSALAWDHPLQAGAIGVTGSPAANELARDADCVLAVGTRLQDFTTGSHSLFAQARLVGINVERVRCAQDGAASPWTAMRASRSTRCAQRSATGAPTPHGPRARSSAPTTGATTVAQRHRHAPQTAALPYDGEVIGAVQRSRARLGGATTSSSAPPARCPPSCTSSGARRRPAAITSNTATRAWATRSPAASASRWRRPEREVIVMVGDGSYLMMNCEIATSVMLGAKLDHRRARQSRLRLHQPAAAGVRRRAVQQPVRRLRAGPARRAARSTSPRMRASLGAHGRARREHRRTRSRAAARARRRSHAT